MVFCDIADVKQNQQGYAESRKIFSLTYFLSSSQNHISTISPDNGLGWNIHETRTLDAIRLRRLSYRTKTLPNRQNIFIVQLFQEHFPGDSPNE
ncbi:MAG: hypothetical protein NUV74_00930 [Candidatus Brocadiaceae bacterium]|nr:hypothetical protein [Candidatus Brocadiaceae bacterium]